jgi:hypothetical protein
VANVGTSKAGGTISQQTVVHPWLATDAQKTNKVIENTKQKQVGILYFVFLPDY